MVCFIEVKTQKENKGFYPEDKVNYKKQKKLVKLSQSWFSERKISLDSKWQIDVIGILLNQEKKKTEIRHFKNVVEAS
ncbi:YraN family protein [Patescibacteria group bacterium]|nr:YraN family protein [Patescibacteria group bacterium]